ncbi:MAG: hypothetical protein AAFR29_06055 [Pseudomonadota bacterium]
MNIETAELILLGGLIYGAIGFVAALLAVIVVLPRLDAAATRSGILFRLLMIPGLVLLWPVMLVRFGSGRKINQPIEGAQHQ